MDGRYSRNIPALTAQECSTLRNKRVCVAGCGGLGGFIIELLARTGVGALTVIDGDVFDVTNLNRQLLCEEEYIGRSKAEIAALRAGRINSDVAVTAVPEFLTRENARSLLSGCDLVMDALDSAESRRVLADVCTDLGLYLVHGAISGWFAQASVIAPNSGVISKLYPERGADYVPRSDNQHAEQLPQRGNLGFAASICASVQTGEAVKLLCDRQPALLGKLLLMDFKAMEFNKLDIHTFS